MPAYDEFEDKYARRPPTGNPLTLPRLRRNRRTTIYIGVIILVGLYYIWGRGPFANLDSDDDISDSDLLESNFAPWFGSKLAPGPNDGFLLSSKSAPRHRLKLAKLFKSLTSSSVAGLRTWNQNVLFVAGDVLAARKLMVVACDMAANQQVQVHFALMGGFPTTIEELEAVNGIGEDSESDCRINFHDATAGGKEALGENLGLLIDAAMAFIHRFLHPQVMIVDEENETPVFMKAIQDASWGLHVPIIELPSNAAENLRWMTKLDSGGLRNWKKPKVEIYIRSDKHHGNLERLLKSLRSANYFGILPARVTIEISGTETLHPFTQSFLEDFGWPSRDRISIRYNILSPQGDNLIQAANHIQDFYPVDKDTSILFLDPNVELSPYYFHWLHYVTLEYRYSSYPNFGRQVVYGASLMLPDGWANGGKEEDDVKFDPMLEQSTPWLYTAPNKDAALYFPDMWITLHTYMRWRVKAALEGKLEQSPANHAENVHDNLVGVTLKDSQEKDDLLSGATELDTPPPKTIPLGKQGSHVPPMKLMKGLEEKEDKIRTVSRSRIPLPGESSDGKDTSTTDTTTSNPAPQTSQSKTPKYNFNIPHTPSLSPTITSSWLIYLLELVVARGGTMLYPGFGAPLHPRPPPKSPISRISSPPPPAKKPAQESPNVLAILHSEIPSYFRADDAKHMGRNEPRLIEYGTLLDVLPGWELPDLTDLPVRNLRGEVSSQEDLETDAKEYKTQVMGSCMEDRRNDWLPVREIFCD